MTPTQLLAEIRKRLPEETGEVRFSPADVVGEHRYFNEPIYTTADLDQTVDETIQKVRTTLDEIEAELKEEVK